MESNKMLESDCNLVIPITNVNNAIYLGTMIGFVILGGDVDIIPHATLPTLPFDETTAFVRYSNRIVPSSISCISSKLMFKGVFC